MPVKERRGGARLVPSRTKHRQAEDAASSSRSAKHKKEWRAEVGSLQDDDDNVLARTSLDLSNHPIPPLEALAKTIAQFTKLQKLDLSSMKASPNNPTGLSSLQWLGRATRKGKEKAADEGSFGDSLTWFKMTDNPALGEQSGADAWAGIENLAFLAVLNASSCALTTAPPALVLLKLSSLAALVLAHNSITTFTSLPYLPHLNTLVLSHNRISRLPKDLAANLPSLKKLSITQNALQWASDESPLPDFTLCSHLREVRLSGNSRLGRLPPHLSTWGRGEGRDRKGTGLETLELADCGLADWTSVEPLIKMTASDDPPRKRRGLGNLSLKGNALTKLSHYHQRILEAHPTLRTLDGDKVERNAAIKSVAVKDDVAPPPVSSTLAQGEKRRKTSGKEPLKASHDVKNATNGETTAEKVSDVPNRGSKMRVRGKRGGRAAKADADGHGNEHEATSERRITSESKKALRAEGNGKHRLPGRTSEKSSEGRIAKRAERVASSNESKEKRGNVDEGQKLTRDEGVVEQNKKRKAWDEGTEEKVVYGRKKLAQPFPPQMSKEKERAQTSVAAVIQLNKKQKGEATKIDEPIWSQIGGAEANLGGSAWD